jgi:hypothetical protein
MIIELEMEDGSVKVFEHVKNYNVDEEDSIDPPDDDDEDQDEGEISGDNPDEEPETTDAEESE